MKISYLLTVSTETDTLERLLVKLEAHTRDNDDEVIILFDDGSNYKPSLEITKKYFFENQRFKIYTNSLNNNYGAHKNYGNRLCSGEWIFQCDGDECPPDTLLSTIHDIIDANHEVELFYVPRINDFRGVTEEHAKKWGWRLTPSKFCNNNMVVNWPDYQGRIYRNIPDRIKWDRKLHEKIVGHKQYSFLPMDEDWALYHDKTIEKQIETNLRYNKVFTEEDNKGHTIV